RHSTNCRKFEARFPWGDKGLETARTAIVTQRTSRRRHLAERFRGHRVQAALCQCCWRMIRNSKACRRISGDPVSTERVLFLQNESCFCRTSPVSTERVLFLQNESCFFRTCPVCAERVLFLQNESCFPGTNPVSLFPLMS